MSGGRRSGGQPDVLRACGRAISTTALRLRSQCFNDTHRCCAMTTHARDRGSDSPVARCEMAALLLNGRLLPRIAAARHRYRSQETRLDICHSHPLEGQVWEAQYRGWSTLIPSVATRHPKDRPISVLRSVCRRRWNLRLPSLRRRHSGLFHAPSRSPSLRRLVCYSLAPARYRARLQCRRQRRPRQ